jgi:pyridoxamine 5'-phosphate oxidase
MKSLMQLGDLAALRRDYSSAGLAESDLASDPFTQFGRWLADAVAARLPEPNAMVVATADQDGQPSARTVLLKFYDAAGFVFFTNYTSRKGRELAANPRASLVFPWHALSRQVVVVGTTSLVSRAESVAYFRSRPHGSQLGALASGQQSAPVASREVLDERFQELSDRYPEGATVPMPDAWGGVRVAPATVEFWQGRGSRLHDRLRYEVTEDGWRVRRLCP